MQRLLASVDPVFGGFGTTRKFPAELKLQFLLDQFKVQPSAELREILVGQLDALMRSGINDVVFGGIYRYTIDRQMTRPHFEKMLYNQALVAKLFADAADWLDDASYRRFANSVIAFVHGTMRLPNGTLAAAIDADFEGREGGYYLWQESSLRDLPDDIERLDFGSNEYYLYGNPVPPYMPGWQSAMRQIRTTPPHIIENQVTAWNALWVSALVHAGELNEASRLGEAIWASSWSGNFLFRLGTQPGYLDDYSYLASAFWQLHLRTSDRKWKSRAQILGRRMLDLFYRNGEFSYSSDNWRESLLMDLYRDSELPSPLAVALTALKNQATDSAIVQAQSASEKRGNSAAAEQPEHYLTLIQMAAAVPAEAMTIAKGHGMVELQSGDESGRWQLTIHLDPGWHVNASEVYAEGLVPTRVSEAENILQVHYPPGRKATVEFVDEPLNAYAGSVEIEVLTTEAARQLAAEISLQACSSRICLPPEVLHLHAFRRSAGHSDAIAYPGD